MQNTTTIWELKENGTIERKSTYTLDSKRALIAFAEQHKGNNNTWTYPEIIPGMRQSKSKPDNWYIDIGTSVFSAIPD